MTISTPVYTLESYTFHVPFGTLAVLVEVPFPVMVIVVVSLPEHLRMYSVSSENAASFL